MIARGSCQQGVVDADVVMLTPPIATSMPGWSKI